MNVKPLSQELDPRYDLSGHSSKLTFESEVIKKELERYVVNLFKSAVRGGTVGGILGGAAGTIASLVSGNDVGSGAIDGFIKGVILGYAIDVVQYDTRYMIYRIKHTIVYPIYRLMRNKNSA